MRYSSSGLGLDSGLLLFFPEISAALPQAPVISSSQKPRKESAIFLLLLSGSPRQIHHPIKYLNPQSLLNGNKNQVINNLKTRECTNPNSKLMQHRRVTFGYTKALKDIFRKLQRKRNFPKCCRSLPPWVGAEFLKNIWCSRMFLCGFQGCFSVVSKGVSLWFSRWFLLVWCGFFPVYPTFHPQFLPFGMAFHPTLLDEGILDTFLSYFNLKWLIRGDLMPEVIHDVGIPHGELGVVSTLLWAFQGSASLVLCSVPNKMGATGFNIPQFPHNAQKPHHSKGGLHKTYSTFWYPQIRKETRNGSGMQVRKFTSLHKLEKRNALISIKQSQRSGHTDSVNP